MYVNNIAIRGCEYMYKQIGVSQKIYFTRRDLIWDKSVNR